MATEILLLSDVKDLGDEGKVVKVADGYARNYLIPKGLGAPVTAATRRRLAKLRESRDEAKKAEVQGAHELAAQITRVQLTIPVKVGTEEKIFGSVTNADVADGLKSEGFEIDRHKVLLDEPIRELGVYDVKIKLHPEVEAFVKVWVVEE